MGLFEDGSFAGKKDSFLVETKPGEISWDKLLDSSNYPDLDFARSTFVSLPCFPPSVGDYIEEVRTLRKNLPEFIEKEVMYHLPSVSLDQLSTLKEVWDEGEARADAYRKFFLDLYRLIYKTNFLKGILEDWSRYLFGKDHEGGLYAGARDIASREAIFTKTHPAEKISQRLLESLVQELDVYDKQIRMLSMNLAMARKSRFLQLDMFSLQKGLGPTGAGKF